MILINILFCSCSFRLSRSTALQVMTSTLDRTQLLDYTMAGVRRYLKSTTNTCLCMHIKFNCNTRVHVVRTYKKAEWTVQHQCVVHSISVQSLCNSRLISVFLKRSSVKRTVHRRLVLAHTVSCKPSAYIVFKSSHHTQKHFHFSCGPQGSISLHHLILRGISFCSNFSIFISYYLYVTVFLIYCNIIVYSCVCSVMCTLYYLLLSGHELAHQWFGNLVGIYSTVQYGAVEYTIIQYNTIQYSIVQYTVLDMKSSFLQLFYYYIH